MAGAVERVHATAVAVGTRAVLIRGPSGSGKSDLALRCLGLPVSRLVPAQPALVADDQVILTRAGSTLKATAPETIRGKIEVRGFGIAEPGSVAEADIVLIADLVGTDPVERYPIQWKAAEILGLSVPLLDVRPFEASSPLKLIMALTSAELPSVAPLR